MTVEDPLARAIRLHRAGSFAEAESIYREILTRQPNQPDALRLLGVLSAQLGRLDAALEFIRRAILIKPNCADAHYNLAEVLTLNGQSDQAIAAFRQTIRIKPDYAMAYNRLGSALMGKGQNDEAIAAFKNTIRIIPNYAEAHNDLGIALKNLQRLEEAIASFRQAIRLKPDLVEAHSNLGCALTFMGRFEEAIAACYQAIRINPGFADAHCNLGKAFKDTGQFDEAMPLYREAIRLKPDFTDAYDGLGNTLHDLGRLDEAIAAYRQSIELKPTDSDAHGNLLFSLNFHPDIAPEAILAEHRAWSDRHARPLMNARIHYQNDRLPDRRLRIGYVSPDFRRHSVGSFFVPLLEHHDRRNFEIFCYANVFSPDDMTERMKQSSDSWRGVVIDTDDAVANMVRSDGIDILVDLSGHTAGGRLRIFAHEPAPIQITYLGYPNTTGMMAIDYRLTDALADLPGSTDHLNVEKLWRLPECAWCYGPAEDAPGIRPRENGPITFGSFNAFAKVNSDLVATWAELLNNVPGSRLLLKSAGAGAASARHQLTGLFSECGIAGERIEMLGKVAEPRRHLESYHQVDVALDTYPYHGTTTTCEALWMGVPVVTLAGQTHVSRVGVSLLSNVGLPELIAQTPQKYVEIVASMTNDLPRLAEMRRTLRSRMRSSPLMDASRFARDIEAAYRQMWRNWCEQTSKSGLQCAAT
jgi:protein O-GlcNAc transferase